MALYTFYPCKADGTSETFTCLELQDDAEAWIRALQVLENHASSYEVVVLAGDRRVARRRRIHPELQTVLGRVRGL